MKRISFLIVSLALCGSPALRAQDAATEERLNKLSGQIEDLVAGQEAIKKRLGELARELENLREQSVKPNASYASQEDLKRLAKAIEEVDRKRLEDGDKIHTELVKLSKTLAAPLPPPKKNTTAPATESSGAEKSAPSEKGIEYVVQQGDTLTAILQACREKNIKVTAEQVRKANPGLNPDRLRPGQKIWIPAPQP